MWIAFRQYGYSFRELGVFAAANYEEARRITTERWGLDAMVEEQI